MSLSSQPKKTEPITDRNHRMTFGKWKGRTIDEVLFDEPTYLVWMHNTLDNFELSAELLDEAEGVDRTDDSLSIY